MICYCIGPGIYCYGRWVQERGTGEGRLYEYVSDYDILVITRSGDMRRDYEVQDIIENRCVYKTPVNAIAHEIGFVNKMLSEGQYFFSDIEQEVILLFDAGSTALAERKPLSPAEAKAIAQQYYEQWFEGAKEFLIDAQNAHARNSLKNGAFYLYQAAERTYNAVILVETGYKPKTHNLDKLKRYSKRFSEQLDSVFPDNTPAEKHLFDLLKRGYVDARYKDNYQIAPAELSTLIDRVEKLQVVAGPLCLQKIASFDQLTTP